MINGLSNLEFHIWIIHTMFFTGAVCRIKYQVSDPHGFCRSNGDAGDLSKFGRLIRWYKIDPVKGSCHEFCHLGVDLRKCSPDDLANAGLSFGAIFKISFVFLHDHFFARDNFDNFIWA